MTAAVPLPQDEHLSKKRRRGSGDFGGEHLHENRHTTWPIEDHHLHHQARDHRHLHHQARDHRGNSEDSIRSRQIAATGNLPTQSKSSKRQIVTLTTTTGRCPLLELPAEIREQIWMHTVTEWTAATVETLRLTPTRSVRLLHKRAIRMDRFNRPPPPALARASRQLRAESLHLYYQLNVFECWRPLFWLKDWSQSTFIDWLVSLGPVQTKWLRNIVLLYKHENELEHDVEEVLTAQGFELQPGVVSNKQELSEYEMCFEELGLPRHFGRRRRWDRWMAATAC
ncbi:hypothetical protein CLAFUW4_08935 [Fulvia fulva]|nr:hypothetical protein CLAFUR4_08941 [Fulvia fulva]KAK4614575.1 hypothetical protein CLAFUR0_08933 [Fulvia fulva]WPV20777.1 hypothetical protein CLAFUW4_08935 [Fulvia fulva]WPV35030.1 hypothetical protein CLAFUW7_08936 [Fulvia fulva]